MAQADRYDAGGWWTELPYPKAVLDRLSREPAESGESGTREKTTGKIRVKTTEKTREKLLRPVRNPGDFVGSAGDGAGLSQTN